MNGLDPGPCGLIVLTLLFFNLIGLAGVTVYAREKVDRLLCNCSVVADNKATLSGLGLMGDIVRIGVVGSLLVFQRHMQIKPLWMKSKSTPFQRN